MRHLFDPSCRHNETMLRNVGHMLSYESGTLRIRKSYVDI